MTWTSLRRRIGPLLAVVWLGVLAVGFFVFQPPLGQRVVLALGRRLLDVASVAALVGLGGAVGRVLLADLADLTPGERAAIQALIGLAAISVAVLLLGQIGAYPPIWLAWLVTLGLLSGLYRPTLGWLTDVRAALAEALTPLDDPLERWLRRAVIGMAVLLVPLALLPPTKWDALVYHLAAPQTYLAAGRIVPVLENHHFGFPQLVESLFLWLMRLSSPQAAALLHGSVGGLLALMLLGLARRVGRPGVGWLALAAMLASDSIWGEFHWPYNDLALMAYTLGAAILLLGDSDRRLLWGGALIGGMMGVKYTAAPFTVGLAVMLIWLRRGQGWRAVVRSLALVVGAALLAFSPWLLKNWLIDGNPLSPFVWGSAAFDDLDAWFYLRPGTGLRPVEVLFYPVQASIFGQEGGTLQSAAGALVFGLLPLAAIGWRRRRPDTRRILTAFSVVAAVGYIWFLAEIAVSWFLAQTRLLFPVFPLLAFAGAVGLSDLAADDRLRVPAGVARFVTAVVVGVMAAAYGVDVVRTNPLPVLAGFETEDSYLTRQLQAYYLTMEQINQLPADARVLFLWEARTYYCHRDCVPDSLINRWWHDQQTFGDPAAIAADWQEAGFTHVLIFEAGGRFLIEQEPYDPLTEDDWAALADLREKALTPVWAELDSYTLYELKDADR